MEKAKRGFAAMDKKTQRAMASKGGKSVSNNRAHMADIGRKGGHATSKDREFMSRIGKLGGASPTKKIKDKSDATSIDEPAAV